MKKGEIPGDESDFDLHKPDDELPDFDLLTLPDRSRDRSLSDDELRDNLGLIVDTLRLFGVPTAPGDITPGVTITRYELYPGDGVRLESIVSLRGDISRVLCAERINIVAPVPGKMSVGIDVLSSTTRAITFRELLQDRAWNTTVGEIPIALGKDVFGKTIVTDLARMPHLIIGGTLGSGKSDCINAILLGFLFRFKPTNLHLILISSDGGEMQLYNSIPHLILPLVTDPKSGEVALKWAINEMSKRFKAFSAVGSGNVNSFNNRKKQKLLHSNLQMEMLGLDETSDQEGKSPSIPDQFPRIVVFIETLADFVQPEIEDAIARLTARGSSAGIHVILASETPVRELTSGAVTANVPVRISFKVMSATDSLLILQEKGAEKLLGSGEFLFKSSAHGGMLRGQGVKISEEEVKAVVNFWGDQTEAVYSEEIDNNLSGQTKVCITEEDQKLILECLEVIRQEKRASISNLQRRLRLGYNRAAYVIDFLERKGVLGPGEGAKPRDILIDIDNYIIKF